MSRITLLPLALLLLLAGCGSLQGIRAAVARLTSPVSLAPDDRLTQAMRDPGQCQAILREEGVAFTPARDQADGEFCLVANAVLLGPTPVRMSPARTMMSCPLAAGLVLWSRHSVEPAARELLGAGLAQVDHYGVYACRRVNGQSEGRPSAHARAEALDVAGFRLTDGRRVGVEADWGRGGPEAAFLHRVRDDACRVFGSVLSPDYNALHHNHLHLEAGGRGPCS
jgi:hypothetical protein